MEKVLVAGATGYLGRHVVRELKKQGYWVRVLARNPKKLGDLKDVVDDLHIGEITRPDTINRVCEDIDYIISSVGITRQKDGLTYMDVDYQGNMNLLEEANKHNVSKFVYVSVLNAHLMMDLKIIRAKEKFVQKLKKSETVYTVIRPTGFFSDMLEFLTMAQKGKVALFGSGENKINPIHGADLAEICVQALPNQEKEISVGGPEIFTFKEIAELAFAVLKREPKISSLPLWMIRAFLPVMRTLTSVKTYGPLEFMATAMTMDGMGTPYGKEKLQQCFETNI